MCARKRAAGTLPAFRGEVCNFAQTLWAAPKENDGPQTLDCDNLRLPFNDDRVQRLGHFALLPVLWADRNGHCFRGRFERTSKIASQRRQPVEWFRRGGTAPRSGARYSMRDLQ
jgi:hypothetical protein